MLGRSFKIASLLMLMALAAAAQTIPAGTRLTVRVGSEISSGTAKAGDRFDATLARPLVVNGKTLARTGASGPRQGDFGEIQRTPACSGRTYTATDSAYRSTDGWFRSRLMPTPSKARATPRAMPRKLAAALRRGIDWRVGWRRQRRCDRGGRRRRGWNWRGGCNG